MTAVKRTTGDEDARARIRSRASRISGAASAERRRPAYEARVARFAELRGQGASKAEAAARIGIAASTAQRYERLRLAAMAGNGGPE